MKKTFLLTMAVGMLAFGMTGISVYAAEDMAGTFQTLEIGEGTKVFSYTASELNDPMPMMTPVFFVYSDSAEQLEGEDEAYQILENAGLIDLAEEEKAGVFLMTPENGTGWETADADVYWEILSKLTDGSDELGVGYFTYCNLIYAVGEGTGATFIHDVLSKNANRISGVLTFGGEISDTENTMPLPAYLVGADDAVASYYKAVNDTDQEVAEEGRTCYYNTTLETKKVMVDDRDVKVLDREILEDAWNVMLSKITRNAIHDVIWGGQADTKEVFTLMNRIDPEEAGLDLKYVEPDGKLEYYIWQPKESLNQADEKYPLVYCMHGGNDHPVFEAESQGWVEVAAQERFILVSPGGGNSEPVENNQALIDYLCENYPIDTSRIYATGVSAGGCRTADLISEYPELLAGAGPIAASPGIVYSEEKFQNHNGLPIFYGQGTNDLYMTNWDGLEEDQYAGDSYMVSSVIDEFLNPAFLINQVDFSIDKEALDYIKYPFLGFDFSEYTESLTTKHGIEEHVSTLKDETGVPYLRLVIAEGLNHNHYCGWAPMIWDFLKDFSRDTQTGASIYNGK